MNFKDLLFAGTVISLLSAPALATPIIYEAGTAHYTEQVIDASNGADLNGVQVTACFTSIPCQTVSFDGTVGNSTFGEAAGNGWRLSLAGDSFISPFVFESSTAITQLILNGAPANIVFDAKDINAGQVGTPGSQLGAFFELISITDGFEPINVVYSNQVLLDQVFYGDLYTTMTMNFSENGASGTMRFYSDTDKAMITTAVPAPATMLLLFAGLVGICCRKKRA